MVNTKGNDSDGLKFIKYTQRSQSQDLLWRHREIEKCDGILDKTPSKNQSIRNTTSILNIYQNSGSSGKKREPVVRYFTRQSHQSSAYKYASIRVEEYTDTQASFMQIKENDPRLSRSQKEDEVAADENHEYQLDELDQMIEELTKNQENTN